MTPMEQEGYIYENEVDFDSWVDGLIEDRKRLEYILDVHLRSHSPHMDGTFGFSFRGTLNGLHRNGRDAIDAAIEQAATWRREAAQGLLEQEGKGLDV